MFGPGSRQTLDLAPAVPPAPEIFTYTRFGASFEPYEYTDWIDESMSWKTTCYIGDWSPLGKLRIRGPGALRFLSGIAVNSFSRFDVGQAKHAVFCNAGGKVMGEGILMKLAEEDFLFTSGPGVLWVDYQFGKGRHDATLEHVGPQMFILQVQGPNALFVMEKAAGEALRDIGFMRFRETAIGGRRLWALRQGMAGEVGYEMHGRLEDAVPIYEAVLEAGREFGIKRLGGLTKMVNHVEACFPTPTVDYVPALFGPDEAEYLDFVRQRAPSFLKLLRHRGSYPVTDMSELYRSPVELGWGKSIKLDHDFIGRAALEEELAAPRRRIATLVWDDADVVAVFASLFGDGAPHDIPSLPRGLLGCMECDRVEQDGTLVGATSSRCYSYFLRKMISLCVIDVGIENGASVEVVWGSGERPARIKATVAPAPLKQDKRRTDVSTLPSYL